MVKMYEKLGVEMVEKLMPEAREALLEAGAHGESKGLGGSKFTLDPAWERGQEVGEPILRAVHGMILAGGRESDLPDPWTHLWQGTFTELIRRLSEGLMTNDQTQKLATQVMHNLQANGLIRRWGKTATYWVAPWPPGGVRVLSTWEAKQSRADKLVMEKRIKEEADKPVTKKFDLGAIPTPKTASPEEIVAYVRRLKECFDRQAEELEQVREENVLLRNRLEWGDTAETIKGIVS